MGGGRGVAVEGGAHPITTHGRGPLCVGEGVNIPHQGGRQLCFGAGDHRLQVPPPWAGPIRSIQGHHVRPRQPDGRQILVAGCDDDGAVEVGAFPQADDQRLRAAAPYGCHVLRGVEPHTGSTVGHAGGGHGGDHFGGMARGALGRLNGNNQPAIQPILVGPAGAHTAS